MHKLTSHKTYGQFLDTYDLLHHTEETIIRYHKNVGEMI
jgi:hypothetical protein